LAKKPIKEPSEKPETTSGRRPGTGGVTGGPRAWFPKKRGKHKKGEEKRMRRWQSAFETRPPEEERKNATPREKKKQKRFVWQQTKKREGN